MEVSNREANVSVRPQSGHESQGQWHFSVPQIIRSSIYVIHKQTCHWPGIGAGINKHIPLNKSRAGYSELVYLSFF